MNQKRILTGLATLVAIVAILGGYFFPVGGESALPLSNPAKIYFTTDDKLKGESGSEIELLSGATLDIQAGATVGFGGAIALAAGSVSAPSLGFTSDVHTGIYRVADHNLGITAGGSLIVDVDTGGLDLNSNLINNIGNIGTDFTSGGGLNLAHGSTLDVDGISNFSETASFAGPVALNGTTTSAHGKTMTINGALTVSETSTLNGGIVVDGTNFTVNGTTGATGIAGLLSANGGVTSAHGKTLTVNGVSTYSETATFNGPVSLNGATTSAHGKVFTVNGTSSFSETATFGPVNIGGTFGITGATTARNLTVGHGYALTVNGTSTYSETATFNGPVALNGATTSAHGKVFTVNGTSSFSETATFGAVNIGGTFGVTGATTVRNLTVGHGYVLTVNGTSTYSETATFNGPVALNGTTTSAHGKTLTVNGTETVSETLSANGGITVDSGKFSVADASGNTVVQGTLGVWGNISNPKSAANDVQVADGMEAQAITATGSVKANAGVVVAHGQDATINGTITVSETGTFGGLLYTTPVSFTASGAQNLTPKSDTYLIDAGGGVSFTLQALTAGKTALITIINTTANRVEILDTLLLSSDGNAIHINEDDGVILRWANGVYYLVGSFTDS